MVIHFKVAGHLACGHHGTDLPSSTELNRVKCRTCRNTEAYKEARRTQRNAARRANRKTKTRTVIDWRSAWTQRLIDLPGLQRLPRGFSGQPFV